MEYFFFFFTPCSHLLHIEAALEGSSEREGVIAQYTYYKYREINTDFWSTPKQVTVIRL